MNRSADVMIVSEHDKVDQVMFHHRINATHEGAFFLDLIKGGMLAAVPMPMREEDRARGGDQEMRLMLPVEVIERAAMLTKLAFDICEENGWIKQMPAADELKNSPREQTGFLRTVPGPRGA